MIYSGDIWITEQLKKLDILLSPLQMPSSYYLLGIWIVSVIQITIVFRLIAQYSDAIWLTDHSMIGHIHGLYTGLVYNSAYYTNGNEQAYYRLLSYVQRGVGNIGMTVLTILQRVWRNWSQYESGVCEFVYNSTSYQFMHINVQFHISMQVQTHP